MTTKLKSGLLLLATLVIGMILGALLNARMVEDRFERIAFMRGPRGFTRTIESAIRPESEEQRALIQAILDDAEVEMRDHTLRSRSELAAVLDSTRSRLKTVLNDEQLRRLEDRLQFQRSRRFRQDGSRTGGERRRPIRQRRQ